MKNSLTRKVLMRTSLLLHSRGNKTNLILIIFLWAVTCISRLKYNGFIYGFDYSIYQPDGANYTFRTLSWIFNDNFRAAKEVSDWYLIHGIKHNVIDPTTLLPENNPVWYLSAPRILYSFLSIPFVLIFGIPGMLAIPCLSLLGLMIVIHALSKQIHSPWAGFAINLALCSSPTVTRWFVANITDGLLTLLLALFLLLEVKVRLIKVWVVLALPVIILSSITRFCLPIFFFLGLGYLLTGDRLKGILTWLYSFTGFIPILFFSPQTQLAQEGSVESFWLRAINWVSQAMKVLGVEIAELLVLDKILLAVVLIGFYASIKLGNKDGILALACLIGVFVIGFINGTLGVNFRYQIPYIPFAAWSILLYYKPLRSSTIR